MMGVGSSKSNNNYLTKQAVAAMSHQDINDKIDYIVSSHLWDKLPDQNDCQALQQLFKKYSNNQETDRALGAIFGCLIGDALGAYCEFNKNITKKVLDQAMTMPGGGTFGLRIGQYTDDTELAFHMIAGLLRFEPKKPLQSQQQSLLASIAEQYITWLNSNPFDIGITCRKGLMVLENKKEKLKDLKPQQWEQMFDRIMEVNSESQSNGSLMRIAPMAVFLSLIGQKPIDHIAFIKNQIKLMHPNFILQEAGASWVHTLHLLIQRKGNTPKHFQEILQQIKSEKEYVTLGKQGWFEQAEQVQKMAMKANVNMGWAKIAWSYGIRLLKTLSAEESNRGKLDSEYYRQEIQWIIEQAGDTDTNAAIVGGLIGSIIGFRQLPLEYLDRIFHLRFSSSEKDKKKRNDRDPRYEPINVLMLSLRLFEKCKAYRQPACTLP